MYLVARFLRPFDHAEFEAETCPNRLAWIAIRREMSADKKVFEQCKLHSCKAGPIFTDDSYIQAVGVKRSTRVLLGWHHNVVLVATCMAIAIK